MQDYYSADQQLHWLSQILAKINRTFLEKESDDSHTNLYYDTISNRLFGRWFENAKGRYLMSLNLGDLSFELLDQHFNSLWLVSSNGKSILEVESQLDSGLSDLGFSNSGWKDSIHYEIPDYGLNKSPIEHLSESQIALWSNFRSLANYACADLLGNRQAESEIRIWPHHFDTGIYFDLSPRLGIGFGLAMKDQMAEDAYFYLTGYSDAVDFDYANFKSEDSWDWKSVEWKGALLRLGDLKDLDQKAALKKINAFSALVIEQFCAQLD